MHNRLIPCRIAFFFFILFNYSNTKTQLQLNIEVTLKPEQISNLKEFVKHLSLTMHSSVPGSLVIWFALEVTQFLYFFFFTEMERISN